MYIFNPIYKLRSDLKRMMVVSTPDFGGDPIKCFVHPVYAWILNIFDGKTDIQQAVNNICEVLSITSQQAYEVLNPLLSNEKNVYLRYGGVVTVIPPHVLILAEEGRQRVRIDDNAFDFHDELDHKSLRMYRPMNLLLCPTLKCYTDCIYCYADRKHPHKEIDVVHWVNLVNNARQSGIEEIDVTGGEFFMKKGWEEIVKALVNNGYSPDISTKIPLSKQTLEQFKLLGLPNLQYSLDTLDETWAVETLKVNNSYVSQLIESIRYADDIGLNVILKPTLCARTCTPENVQSILDFADTLKNVIRVTVSVIGFSCYKPKDCYRQIRPSMQQINDVRKLVRNHFGKHKFMVADDSFVYEPHEMKNEKAFQERAYCTANMDGFVVLPDGTATICEELYWHPQFTIGNIINQDINDIWNSEHALKLAHLQSSDFPVDSACHSCGIVEQCHQSQGVCWKLVLAAYGMVHPLYPDPRCSQSPIIDDSITVI